MFNGVIWYTFIRGCLLNLVLKDEKKLTMGRTFQAKARVKHIFTCNKDN